MDVVAGELIIHVLQQPLGLALDYGTVGSHQRREVELEGDVKSLQVLIVFLVHIVIALGMGKHGDITLGLDAEEDVVKAAGRAEIGGLDQQMLAFLA